MWITFNEYLIFSNKSQVFRLTHYVYFHVEVHNSFFINLHGFHMVNTKLSNNKKQEETVTTISNEMKCYF